MQIVAVSTLIQCTYSYYKVSYTIIIMVSVSNAAEFIAAELFINTILGQLRRAELMSLLRFSYSLCMSC